MEDFATITGRIIPSLLVTQLKGLIKTLNDTIRPSPQLRIGGNKADLIQRLVQLITEYHNIGDQVVIRQIRHCVAAYSQGDVSTIATPSVPLHQPYTANSSSSSSSSSAGTSTSGSYRTQPPSSSSMLTSKSMPGHSSHHAPYGGGISHRNPHHPAHPIPTTASYRTGMLHNQAQQVFKSSPFYKDIQVISQPRLCVEAKDRTVSVLLPLTIPPMLSMQLKKDPEFQVMVFCGWADGPSSSQTLMEFPHVCEIKVNGKVLEANLRGMKNKPGTVSPANITKLCKLEPADYNKVEFIYANSTKRYYASMHLVKKISVESIVAEIERGKFLSKEKMLQLIEDRNKDDDIMATSSTLSLKCPLGFQRITVPCRSSYCHHLQCFDAYTFFNLNEQTPTWTCPVCSRIMHSWEEIVVDGYFKDILKLTPKSLENITVQADGSWELPSIASSLDQPAAPSPKKQKSTSTGGESVFVIDEDESEDEGSTTPSPAAKSTKPSVEVIDLISDSEDEVEESSLPAQAVTDEDGDSSMQEAANSLQSMATSSGDAAPRSVKTEDLEKSVPVDGIDGEAPPPPPTSAGAAPMAGGTAAVAPEIHSIVGSASGSPPTAPSSASPEISSRMAQTDPNQTGVRSPTSRVPQTVWRDSNEDMFMNALLNPRRKRQFDDTVDTESINAMSYDARQRIARLDIHSNGSSDRGSSSTIPSPDAVRRSTSSPTPVPSFHELERRGYYENGHPMSVAPPIHGTFASQHAPHHHGHVSQGTSQRADSRGATMSPPLHTGYSSASPHHPHHHSHHSHHNPHHRSANSPGPDYYSGLTRPSSTGSLSAVVSMAHRSSSISVGSLSRPTSSSSSSMTAMPAYGNSASSSGWSSNEWRGDLRYMRSGSSNQASHGDNSPRRISTDEAGPSLGHQASFTKYPPSQQHSPPPYHQSHSSYSQSTPQHQRHYSNDDSSFYGRRDGHPSNSNSNGNGSGAGAFHRVDYINNSDEGRGSSSSSSYHHDHGSHSQHSQQHVYSSNHGSRSSSYSSSIANGHEGGSAGVSEDRRRSESSKDEEAPIFSHGIRGARAR